MVHISNKHRCIFSNQFKIYYFMTISISNIYIFSCPKGFWVQNIETYISKMCRCINYIYIKVQMNMPNISGIDTTLSGAIAGTMMKNWQYKNVTMS